MRWQLTEKGPDLLHQQGRPTMGLLNANPFAEGIANLGAQVIAASVLGADWNVEFGFADTCRPQAPFIANLVTPDDCLVLAVSVPFEDTYHVGIRDRRSAGLLPTHLVDGRSRARAGTHGAVAQLRAGRARVARCDHPAGPRWRRAVLQGAPLAVAPALAAHSVQRPSQTQPPARRSPAAGGKCLRPARSRPLWVAPAPLRQTSDGRRWPTS